MMTFTRSYKPHVACVSTLQRFLLLFILLSWITYYYRRHVFNELKESLMIPPLCDNDVSSLSQNPAIQLLLLRFSVVLNNRLSIYTRTTREHVDSLDWLWDRWKGNIKRGKRQAGKDAAFSHNRDYSSRKNWNRRPTTGADAPFLSTKQCDTMCSCIMNDNPQGNVSSDVARKLLLVLLKECFLLLPPPPCLCRLALQMSGRRIRFWWMRHGRAIIFISYYFPFTSYAFREFS